MAAKNQDFASLVFLDTEFHSLIVNLGGRERIQQLWHTLDGQMGSLMRSSLDSQRIELMEVVVRHQELLQVLKEKNPEVIRAALKKHYVPNGNYTFDKADSLRSKTSKTKSSGRGSNEL